MAAIADGHPHIAILVTRFFQLSLTPNRSFPDTLEQSKDGARTYPSRSLKFMI